MFRLEDPSAQTAKSRKIRDHGLRLVFQKASTQTQPILLQRSAGNVVPLSGLFDYTDWQNATDGREDMDRISGARWLAWTLIVEIWLFIVLVLLLVMSVGYRLFSAIFN
jgi:hypothetical protein